MEFNALPGYMWTNQKVVADYTFPIYKPYQEYQTELTLAKESALHIYTIDNSAQSAATNHLNNIYNALQSHIKDSLKSSSGVITESIYNELINIPISNLNNEIDKIHSAILNYMEDVYNKGFVNEAIYSIPQSEIAIQIEPNTEKIVKKQFLIDISTLGKEAKKKLESKFNKKKLALVLEIINSLNHPNLILSRELTAKNKNLSAQSVARYEGLVREGETIIAKGEIVTESTIKKLQSYSKIKLMKSEVNYTIWSFFGGFGHSVIIYSIFILYLFFIRKKIFADNFQLGLLSALIVLSAFMGWLSITIFSKLPIEFLIMIPSLSMLAAIVFDSRTAFYVTVSMALMISGIRGNDYITGLIFLFVGTIAAYTVRDIQNRSQMFQSILFIFIAFLFGIGTVSLERSVEMSTALNQLMMASINSLVAPMLTFGFLLLLERFTVITTDLKLQEYDRQNHPLLQKLNEIAPGTYQHTLQMASLAERCALAISANPLLAKVGAMYHDIGKIAKPEYFIENQINFENKHDLMSPKKSAEAIRQHVIEGIKMAHEYNLPQRIIDFIPTHHGTTLIKHFYAVAIEQADDKYSINKEDFRYPGPKPQSKETAIVMICDFSEALSRLVNNNKEELENAINANIRERLIDGQFDNCDITLKELEILKDTCVKSLLATSHQRVKYKEIP
jgi:hypothetical protein